MILTLPQLPQLFRSNTQWLEKQQTSILSAATIITVFNLISAFSGFIRDRLFIASFFDTAISSKEALDALYVAFQIPDLLFQLIIVGAMAAAFMPVFISYKKQDEQMAFKITSALMTWLLGLFAIFSVAAFFLAEPITHWRTGTKFSAEQIEIVVNLTRIMLLGQFFLATSSFLGSILNSYQRFIMPALAPVLYNLGILLGVWCLSPYLGIYSAGVGVVIGGFIHMAAQIPFVRRLGFRFRPTFDLSLPGIKQIFKLTPPRLLAIGASESRGLLLGFFATSLGNSSMLIMELTRRVMTVPIRLFGIPISQASLPFLSDEAAKDDHEKFNELIVQSLNQIAFFIMPASVLILILRLPIVRLLFGTDNLPWDTTRVTSYAVGIIAISIAAQGLVSLLIRAFYALKDTRTPLYVAIVDMILYMVLCAIMVFVLRWDVLGLALATTITGIFELGLMLWLLDRKLGCFRSKRFIVPQLKMLSSSFFMAIFLYLPFRILDKVVFNSTRTLELIELTIVTSTIGLLAYIYFSALFEVKELAFFTNLFQSFGKWQKPLEKSPEVLVDSSSVEGDTL
jgi:putative peptidoglycan lipid II flippase